MLFRPWGDFDGERVWLKRGTKGGRPRYLFLHNAKQREVLEEVRALVASAEAALIPGEWKTFDSWRQHCYHEFRKAGLGQEEDVVFHDLRRSFACERMKYLMEVRGRTRDDAAGLVARELGHSRTEGQGTVKYGEVENGPGGLQTPSRADDSFEEARKEAVQAVVAWGGPEAARRAAEGKGPGSLLALAKLRAPVAMERTLAALGSPDPGMRQAGLTALRELDAHGEAARIEKLLGGTRRRRSGPRRRAFCPTWRGIRLAR